MGGREGEKVDFYSFKFLKNPIHPNPRSMYSIHLASARDIKAETTVLVPKEFPFY